MQVDLLSIKTAPYHGWVLEELAAKETALPGSRQTEGSLSHCVLAMRDAHVLGGKLGSHLTGIVSAPEHRVDHPPSFLGYTRALRRSGLPGGLWWLQPQVPRKHFHRPVQVNPTYQCGLLDMICLVDPFLTPFFVTPI